METTSPLPIKAVTLVLVSGLLSSFSGPVLAADSLAPGKAQGKAIAFDRSGGNCLACHMMADGELPGNSGPPLLQMKTRFPDRAALRSQIWDATENNPTSVMPPYGRHQILSEKEIDLVVDFVYSL